MKQWQVVLTGLLATVSFTASPSATAASAVVNEHRAVDPHGVVEIVDTDGKLSVQGWDKAEVEVTGSLGSEADRLDITETAGRVTIRVVGKGGFLHWVTGSAKTQLSIKVPAGASLVGKLTSADLTVGGVAGNQEIQSVSGDLSLAAASDVRVRTVSGDVRVTAATTSHVIAVSTVSGDATLNGGSGELTFESVSGDAHVKAGTLSRVALKSVSGDMDVSMGLTADGHVDGESVSGSITLHFVGALPPADYEASTISGDLSTCTGRKGARDDHNPSSRLAFREGAATGRVRLTTKSGDIRLCNR